MYPTSNGYKEEVRLIGETMYIYLSIGATICTCVEIVPFGYKQSA